MHKIMVVEDDPTLRALILEIIQDLNVDTISVSTADAAFAYLQQHGADIHVIVSDIRTPGRLDGADLANQVVTYWPHVQTVLTSGYSADALSKLIQPTMFLPKPWTGDLLLEVVEKMLARSA